MNDVLYFNGRWTTTAERVLGVEDRGFEFGDAVYEVFKFLRQRPIFALDHFRRMDRGLREVEIRNPWNEITFTKTIEELLDRTAFESGIVYIQVSRGESERAHFYPDDMAPTAIAYSRRFNFPDQTMKERGIRLITVPDMRWKRCDVKSVNLLANSLAKKRAQRAAADEALLVGDGVVREGASSSFFVVVKGRVITHPLDEHILPGVVRDRTIGLALAFHRIAPSSEAEVVGGDADEEKAAKSGRDQRELQQTIDRTGRAPGRDDVVDEDRAG